VAIFGEMDLADVIRDLEMTVRVSRHRHREAM
jgi:hypothetical protein